MKETRECVLCEERAKREVRVVCVYACVCVRLRACVCMYVCMYVCVCVPLWKRSKKVCDVSEGVCGDVYCVECMCVCI